MVGIYVNKDLSYRNIKLRVLDPQTTLGEGAVKIIMKFLRYCILEKKIMRIYDKMGNRITKLDTEWHKPHRENIRIFEKRRI